MPTRTVACEAGVPIEPASTGLEQAFAAMRAAQTRDPFPDWPLARRAAARARTADARQSRRDRRGDRRGLRPPPRRGNRPARNLPEPVRHPPRAAPRPALDAPAPALGRTSGSCPRAPKCVPQPLGVVGIIVPWNYPLYLAVGPLAAALAAGNRAMVKMSRVHAALLGAVRASCARGISAHGEVAVVTGDAEVGARVRGAAVRPSAVHRLDRGRPQGDARGRGEPDAGDARARRQVAGDHRARMRGSTHAVERIAGRQAAQRRARPASRRTTCCCRATRVRRIRRRRARGGARGCTRTSPRNPHYASIVIDRHYARLRGVARRRRRGRREAHVLGRWRRRGARARVRADAADRRRRRDGA